MIRQKRKRIRETRKRQNKNAPKSAVSDAATGLSPNIERIRGRMEKNENGIKRRVAVAKKSPRTRETGESGKEQRKRDVPFPFSFIARKKARNGRRMTNTRDIYPRE